MTSATAAADSSCGTGCSAGPDAVTIVPGAASADGATGAVSIGRVRRVPHPADVHELDDDLAARVVDGVGDLTPPVDLGLGVDAGGLQVPLARRPKAGCPH